MGSLLYSYIDITNIFFADLEKYMLYTGTRSNQKQNPGMLRLIQ